jgi:hypothetical protein
MTKHKHGQEWKPPSKEFLKQSFGRFAIALHDIQFARLMWRRTNEALEAKDWFAAVGFKSAFFASYGRLFIQTGKGASTIPQEPPFVPKPMRSLHKQILKVRNGFVAHSDISLRQIRIYPPGSKTADGELVSYVASSEWKWALRNIEFAFNKEELDSHLDQLEAVIKAKATKALSDLESILGLVVVVETPLDAL